MANSEPPPASGRAIGAAGAAPATPASTRAGAVPPSGDPVSALFPHAGGDQVNEFRWAFAGGVVGLAVLVTGGLIVAAIILAALLVPVLYVMYLYEVRVYRDAPVPIVGLTLGGGILLGIVVTAVANRFVPNVPLVVSTPFGDSVDVGALILVGLVLPLLREALKPWPALILRGRSDVSQTVDGLVLGIATGLGFSIAETLIRFSQILTARDLDTAAAGWIYPLLSVAIFTPLVSGSTTGLITASLWRYRPGQRLGGVRIGAIVLALGANVANVLGTRLLVEFGVPQILALGWELVVTGIVLVSVRVLLVRAMAEEERELGLGPHGHVAPREAR